MGDFAFEEGLVGDEGLLDIVDLRLPRVGVFFEFFINSFFEENLLQRHPMPLTFKLMQIDFEVFAQHIHGVLGVDAQDFADAEQGGFAVVDHPRVGVDVHLAVGEGIERVNGLVG